MIPGFLLNNWKVLSVGILVVILIGLIGFVKIQTGKIKNLELKLEYSENSVINLNKNIEILKTQLLNSNDEFIARIKLRDALIKKLKEIDNIGKDEIIYENSENDPILNLLHNIYPRMSKETND